MKIGLVCPYNMAKGGGVQETVRAMHRGLTNRGHDVRIITPEPRDLPDRLRTGEMLFVGSAAEFKSLATTSQISATADVYEIEYMLEREKFDILHFHEPWVPMLSRQILSRSQSINVATFHAKLPETVMTRTLASIVTPYTKAVLRDLDELTAVSEAAAEYVRTMTDAPVTIIPNGIDLSVYRVDGIGLAKGTSKSTKANSDFTATKPGLNRRRKILFIGRLERRKGVMCLLQAFALFVEKNPDVDLIIAGDGPDRRKLELRVQDLEIPNVTFLGYVSEKKKLRLLAEADLFCAPALYGESFGIVLLEAMASGLVTVAGNNPGYVSVMQELGSLSLVNPKDSLEFADRLDVMMNNEDLRKLWRKWAATYVKQFNYPTIVEAYIKLYQAANKQVLALPITS